MASETDPSHTMDAPLVDGYHAVHTSVAKDDFENKGARRFSSLKSAGQFRLR